MIGTLIPGMIGSQRDGELSSYVLQLEEDWFDRCIIVEMMVDRQSKTGRGL